MPIHVSLSPLEPKRKAVEAIATGLTAEEAKCTLQRTRLAVNDLQEVIPLEKRGITLYKQLIY
jgi:hypothetical protein